MKKEREEQKEKLEQDEIFCLTDKSMKDIRYIRLDKKASYQEQNLKKVYMDPKEDGKEEGEYCEMRFYSFGFYDALICMKTQMNISQAHKKHFLIEYPFQKTAETLKVEQWFGILPLSKDGKYQQGVKASNADEPFFCDTALQSELPFVGVILISLKNTSEDFRQLAADYVGKINNIFGNENLNEGKRYLAQVYYSLNCVDLCIVIRTDRLPFIHRINYELNDQAQGDINTTVLFALQDMPNLERVLKTTIAKNSEVEFIVRSNQKSNPAISKEESKGVNGIGRYVTRFGYKEYAALLPELVKYKLNGERKDTSKAAFISNICHEREWFQETSDRAYESVADYLQNAVCKWIEDIYSKISKIEKHAEDYFSCAGNIIYQYRKSFIYEIHLVKELVNTYSDLWYHNSQESGFVFFAQLWIVLQGIEELLCEIEERKGSEDEKESLEQLINTMHQAVCSLNGYNKQFQMLNQDSVNFPSYEIHSKVNAEKYMAAYCAFLHKFFALYYKEKKDHHNVVQLFPLALVELSKRQIEANLYFQWQHMKNKKSDNHEVRSMFAVHFPSSEYFSNVWKSVPLLMHEASHSTYFGEVENRNQAVLYNINQYMAEKLANQMISVVNDGSIVSISVFVGEILKKAIYCAIEKLQERYFEERGGMEKWRFRLMGQNCLEFFDSIFDQSDDIRDMRYSQFVKFKAKIAEDVEYVVKTLGFETLCYAFSKEPDYPSGIYYFINVLYLEFHPEFYEKYKSEYDTKFLKDLTKEIHVEREDDVEQRILKLAYERFNKFIERDEKNVMEGTADQIKENSEDNLYIAFSVVVAAGTWAIFERYKSSFFGNVSKQKYCNKLIPKLFTDDSFKYTERLSVAYREFVKEMYEEDSQTINQNKQIMKHMLQEYYEIYTSINNIVMFLSYSKFSEENTAGDNMDDFVQLVHDTCRKLIYEEEEKDDFQALFSRSNREILVKLGFFEEKSTILKGAFEQVVLENGSGFVRETIGDRLWIFQEVYADCGMCCSVGFDPFGYCVFASSVYPVEDEGVRLNENRAFLADRLLSVIMMYIEEENWPELFEAFLQKLFDVEMIKSICKILPLDITVKSWLIEKLSDEEYKISLKRNANYPKDILQEIPEKDIFIQWRDDVIDTLIDKISQQCGNKSLDEEKKDRFQVAEEYLRCIYGVVDLIIEEDILSHLAVDSYNGFFQNIRQYMKKDKGMRAVREDACVKEISKFYNMDCPEGEEDKFEWYYKLYSGRFATESNFIFNYYCEHRNAYHYLAEQVVNKEEPIGKWFDVIDGYYQKEVE